MGVHRFLAEEVDTLTAKFGPTPAGYVDLFIDDDDLKPYYRTSAGTVLPLKGDQGDASTVPGPQGDKGWSPLLATETDGARRVLRLVDWTGGAGTKPTVPSNNYLGSAGLTTLALATDIRGPQGVAGTTPSNQVTTDTTQTGLTGDKTSSGSWTVRRITATDTTDATGGVWDGPNRVYSDSNPPQTLVQTESASEPATPASGTGIQYVLAADSIPRYKNDQGQVFWMVRGATQGIANLLDYGADPTGATASDAALDAAIAALPAAGGIVRFPAGVIRLTSAPYIVSKANVTLEGFASNVSFLKTDSTTGDQLRITGYGSGVRKLSIQGPGTGTTSQKTSGIGLDVQATEGRIEDVNFTYQWECARLGGHLVDLHGSFCRYFGRTGIIVDHNSDHRITDVTMNNAAATLPTLAGIDVRVTASLVLEQLNVINSNFALNISPATGVTVPSVKATDCFFDTSVVGLNMQGAGAVFRSEFTNCWFSSMTTAGIRIQPAAGGTVDAITWVNCDIYNNVAGTTSGVLLGGSAGAIGKLKFSACTVAGWTRGLDINPAGVTFFPQFSLCTIGAAAAFAANGTGVVVAAGTYRGLILSGNDVQDNTVNATIGAMTITAATAAAHRIIDNAGINPRAAAVTPPAATPALATTYTNTYGYRVQLVVKHGATANTGVTLNGVTNTMGFVAAQVMTYLLEPGGTILFTGGTAPTVWVWNAL